MNCIAEALGLAPFGNGTIPAVMSERRRLAKKMGMRIVELVKKDIKPRQIATIQAFKNAITVEMALGSSTNTVLHLPAIAKEAGIKLELDIFDLISRKTPNLMQTLTCRPISYGRFIQGRRYSCSNERTFKEKSFESWTHQCGRKNRNKSKKCGESG